jgi:hypothetical protein
VIRSGRGGRPSSPVSNRQVGPESEFLRDSPSGLQRRARSRRGCVIPIELLCPLHRRGRLLDPVGEQTARQARDLKRYAAGTVGADHVEIEARDEQILAVG